MVKICGIILCPRGINQNFLSFLPTYINSQELPQPGMDQLAYASKCLSFLGSRATITMTAHPPNDSMYLSNLDFQSTYFSAECWRQVHHGLFEHLLLYLFI